MTESMKNTKSTDKRHLLLAIARGEADWRALERLGVKPGLDQSPPTWWEPDSLPVVTVTAQDLATGLLAHLSSARARQEWAQAIEFCGSFDLAPLAGDPGGDLVLDALWSASFGEPISDEPLAAIREIAEGPADRQSAAAVGALQAVPNPVTTSGTPSSGIDGRCEIELEPERSTGCVRRRAGRRPHGDHRYGGQR